jgi:pimeloyl-ACP methyl ester carboxylesterase
MIMNAHRRLAGTGGVLLALALALTGCTSSGDDAQTAATSAPATSSSAAAEAQPIDWQDCTGDITPIIAGRPGSDRPLGFQCGTTTVPVSYADPGGGTLQLFLVKATLAGQANRIGSLVVNPGGPGQSATDAAIQSALTLPVDVLGRFDVVGVDPRGVGLSSPAVQCISDEQKDELFAADPRATDAASLAAAFGRVDAVGEACSAKYKEALGAFDTVDSARDMDLVRQSLGDEQLTYLGYSYGTTLGSTYAELFPDKVRALVLDAVVDPDGTPQEDAEQSAASLEAGFDAFGVNCVGLIAGCPLGGDPRGFVEALLAQAEQTPIPSSEPDQEGETRLATPGVVLTAILSALYDTASWPQLAQALAAGQQGDSAGLFSLADSYSGRLEDGSYSNLLDANIAINCADSDPDRTVDEDEVRALAAEWHAKYPFFGAGSATGLYTCSVWEAERTPLPERDAAGSKAILVVGNAGDPVTPLPGAVDLAEDLTSAVLLTWQGQGHTSYPKTQCVNDAVNRYLIDLVVPLDGLTCPA